MIFCHDLLSRALLENFLSPLPTPWSLFEPLGVGFGLPGLVFQLKSDKSQSNFLLYANKSHPATRFWCWISCPIVVASLTYRLRPVMLGAVDSAAAEQASAPSVASMVLMHFVHFAGVIWVQMKMKGSTSKKLRWRRHSGKHMKRLVLEAVAMRRP